MEKYLSPVSGKITTTTLPLPKSFATLNAAQMAAPADIPTHNPSSLANLLEVLNASLSFTGIISSIMSRSNTWGMKPAPMP